MSGLEEIAHGNIACGIVTVTDSNIPPHPASLTSGANFEAEPGQEKED